MIKKTIALLLSILFFSSSVTLPTVQARMIGTDVALSTAQSQTDRARIDQLLQRTDVQSALEQQGIPVQEARQRVAALSDQEIRQIADRLDQLPAGEDGFGAVLGAAMLVFFVLLITDILGFTHVYPFVNHSR
ncbi:MAG: PA2779 family protein [Desulfuromonadaceae bacterium]